MIWHTVFTIVMNEEVINRHVLMQGHWDLSVCFWKESMPASMLAVCSAYQFVRPVTNAVFEKSTPSL